ncbi:MULTISPECIES: hypothetical protein [Prochlorococcus]|uniref:hypothetical protein n=1 Tax=Prochlorococcus TaxID=1218 RepID=UPI000533733E|nr:MULTISPECIES: hypothetical protein [Prochlorococcus]KGG12102.1 hypothetical protein EV05_1305 [Prochlorococcus sp. MIT 0601]
MSSYYPIPCDFYINPGSSKSKVSSSITLINMASNRIEMNYEIKSSDIHYCIYYIKDYCWIKYSQINCAYGDYIEIKRGDLNLPETTMAVVVRSNKSDNPDRCLILPEPYSSRVDKSPIAERASYNFTFGSSTSSYQGEYPHMLAKAMKSSFLTFDTLRQDNVEGCSSFMLLMNLKVDARARDEYEVSIFRSSDRKELDNLKVKCNSFISYKLPDNLKATSNASNDNLFIICNKATFIPIFITAGISNLKYQITVEHTHPPSELFWPYKNNLSIKKLRSNWVKGI